MSLRQFCAGGAMAVLPCLALAAPQSDIEAIRAEIEALKRQYEARIAALEARLAEAEQKPAAPRQEPAGNPATAFNPAISLILSGTYAHLQRDPATWRLDGFLPSGAETWPGKRSFSLGESELLLSANIDPYLRGEFMLAASPDNEVAVENAYLETLALPAGFTLKAGRFYSGIGYINEQHPHAWDFVDPPYAQQAFLGGNRAEDGVQLKWLLPTDTFFQLGLEAGRGAAFPGAKRNKNGVGAWALTARLGGDAGVGHAWLAGLGFLSQRPQDRRFEAEDVNGNWVENSFSGRSRLWVASLVWKWAPEGNPKYRNFKLQGEYYRSREQGDLTYDLSHPVTDAFRRAQSGWYAQGVYQFAPRWRVGLRFDRLSAGTVEAGANGGQLPVLARHDPRRVSLMADYSPSEYSRFRLQLSRDEARRDQTDNQLLLQYVLSLGAHGAHAF